MKKTLTSLLFAFIFLAGGFGTIAVLTRVSETIDESGTAASQAIQEQDEADFAQIDKENGLAFEQVAEDCLPSELFDQEEKECYYECDTDSQCAALEASLDEEFESLYEDASNVVLSDEAPDENYTATYTVKGGGSIALESGNNQELVQHTQVWELFKGIAGVEFITNHVTEFNVYSSKDNDSAAHVSQTEGNINKWQLAVNLDAMYDDAVLNESEARYTLIHEFAHILSLNPTQVPPATLEELDGDATATACSRFFTGEGCAEKDSYIQQFFAKYWQDIYAELSAESNQTALYEKYQDRFITEYAATNPGEDFSEVFTAFVLKAKPTGTTIVDRKVRFFHTFPELVTLRQQIRSSLR